MRYVIKISITINSSCTVGVSFKLNKQQLALCARTCSAVQSELNYQNNEYLLLRNTFNTKSVELLGIGGSEL